MHMDFLDPRFRRRNRHRLVFVYIGGVLAVIISTVLLVLAANGYGVNTKTGEIVQNGLLFVKSQPSGAKVSFGNSSVKATTDARLVLPTNNYKLTLTKAGYRPWVRHFYLGQQTVVRLDYPLLVPLKPKVSTLNRYPVLPSVVGVTSDQRWLAVGGIDKHRAFLRVYDTNDASGTSTTIKLPAKLLSTTKAAESLNLIAWTNDNNFLLVRHDYGKSSEFLLINRSHADQSLNLNKYFKATPSQVSFRSGQADQLLLYFAKQRSLRVGDISSHSLAHSFLNQVDAYQPLSSSLVLYSSLQPKRHRRVINVWENGAIYTLARINNLKGKLLFRGAQFQGQWYYAIGDSQSNFVNIYKNPLDSLRHPHPADLDALESVKISDVNSLSFANKNRFVAAQNGRRVAVYDFDTSKIYTYSLNTPVSQPLAWADDFRLSGNTNGQLFINDFDGSNVYKLGSTSLPQGGYLSDNGQHLLTIGPAKNKQFQLVSLSLRAQTK